MTSCRRTCAILALIPLIVALAACGGAKPEEIVVADADLTLAWDPPESSDVAVASYRVYYQERGSSGAWQLLGEVTATAEPEYTVEYTSLAVANEYVFAVTSVGVNGVESEYHTSLDTTADPANGWYVTWTP